VDVGLHEVIHRGVDQAMPLQGVEPLEAVADHPHPEMPPAIAGPDVARVQVAFILDEEVERLQPLAEPLVDGGTALRRVQGSTWRKGLTTTRA